MSKRARKSSKSAKPKAYVLLGANEYAKPRAARFSADADPELLAKAADTMHLWLIAVTNDELAELAARLPAGRLHASGGGQKSCTSNCSELRSMTSRGRRQTRAPRKSCRAAGTRSRQVMSSSPARLSSAAGGRRW